MGNGAHLISAKLEFAKVFRSHIYLSLRSSIHFPLTCVTPLTRQFQASEWFGTFLFLGAQSVLAHNSFLPGVTRQWQHLPIDPRLSRTFPHQRQLTLRWTYTPSSKFI